MAMKISVQLSVVHSKVKSHLQWKSYTGHYQYTFILEKKLEEIVKHRMGNQPFGVRIDFSLKVLLHIRILGIYVC